jgi:hypothetical protein
MAIGRQTSFTYLIQTKKGCAQVALPFFHHEGARIKQLNLGIANSGIQELKAF